MKAKSSLRTHLLAACSSLLVITCAHAVSGNWTSVNAGNWSTATNWSSNPTVPGTTAGDVININSNIAGARIVTIDTTSRTVGSLTIGDSDNSHGFTLAASGGANLTFNNNGSAATLTENGSILDTISAPIVLADNLEVTTGGSLTISGIVSETGGARTLTKNGVGTLTLNGNNSYTGLTTINNGITVIGNANALGTTAAGTTINGSNAVAFQGTVLDLGSTALTLTEAFNINGNATGRATIRNNSSANQVLNGNIDVTSATNSAAITSNSSGDAGSITINGDISGTLSGAAVFFLRGVSTSANNRILGNLNITGDLIKADPGTWTVGAASKTYSWTNTGVAGGTLRMGAAGVMPTGTVLTIGQSGASTATFDLNGFSQTVAGIVEASGATTGTRTITSASAATLTMGSASDFTYGGVLSGAGLSLTKTGTGTQTLTAANTHGGTTTVGGGVLAIGNNLALQNSVLDTTGAGSLTFTVTTPTLGGLSGAVDLATKITTGYSAVSTLTLNPGTGVTASYSGVISNGAANMTLIKSGAGTQTLSGANTYSGGTTLSAGRIQFGNNAAFGTGDISVTGSSSIGAAVNSLTIANNINIASGQTLSIVNGGVGTNGSFTGVLSGSGSLNNNSGGNDPKFSNTGNTFNGSLSIAGGGTSSFASLGDGGVTSLGGSGSGTFIWTGGDVTFNTRTFRTTNTGAAGNTNARISNNGSGTLTINTNFVANQTNQSQLQLRGSGNGVFAGTIGDASGTVTTGINKEDSGTWTLAGNNSYTGATNVNGGTLLVSGSTSTGLVNVGAGGTLGGTGTINGTTTISGLHSPGNSPGILTHSGNLSYELGASVLWELIANNTSGRGTNYDGINVGGALAFNGATTLILDFDFGSSAVEWQNAFWDTSYTGTDGWLLYSGATSLTGFDHLDLNSPTAWLDESGDTLASIRSLASFSLFQSGNNIYLNYNAIPEPSTALLAGLGILALLRRKRDFKP
jgi:fibronectin-binding autotransporter adhesin